MTQQQHSCGDTAVSATTRMFRALFHVYAILGSYCLDLPSPKKRGEAAYTLESEQYFAEQEGDNAFAVHVMLRSPILQRMLRKHSDILMFFTDTFHSFLFFDQSAEQFLLDLIESWSKKVGFHYSGGSSSVGSNDISDEELDSVEDLTDSVHEAFLLYLLSRKPSNRYTKPLQDLTLHDALIRISALLRMVAEPKLGPIGLKHVRKELKVLSPAVKGQQMECYSGEGKMLLSSLVKLGAKVDQDVAKFVYRSVESGGEMSGIASNPEEKPILDAFENMFMRSVCYVRDSSRGLSS